MKIKPVNLNKTLKLLEGTEAEKPFIEDMLLYMDQAKEYEEKKVIFLSKFSLYATNIYLWC